MKSKFKEHSVKHAKRIIERNESPESVYDANEILAGLQMLQESESEHIEQPSDAKPFVKIEREDFIVSVNSLQGCSKETIGKIWDAVLKSQSPKQ